MIVSGAFVVGSDSPFEIMGPVALALGALAFFCGIAAMRWGIFQRFRYRADFGTDVTVTMSADGLVGSGRHVEGKWVWAAYPRAVRYLDGIMLCARERYVGCRILRLRWEIRQLLRLWRGPIPLCVNSPNNRSSDRGVAASVRQGGHR